MYGIGSLSNIFSHIDVRPRPLFRRSHSITLPQFEISVVDVDSKTNRKVSLSLQSLPSAKFWQLSQGMEEEDEENPYGHPASPAVLSSDFFLDECHALLSQVPDSFDLGRTRVRLNSIAASARHMALGSECGALFLFNRRIGQSVKPLRTHPSEVISAMEFFSNCRDDTELLAIGHRSGKLVILSLPCADSPNPKLLQHVQDEAHCHNAVQCLCWSFDGRMLFSGDALGMVLATHVDFTNAQFPIVVVEEGGANKGPLVGMLSSGPFFAFAKGQKCKVCNWQRDGETLTEVTTQKQIVGIHFSSNLVDRLSLLLSDGTVFRKDFSENSTSETSELVSIFYDVFHDQQVRVMSFSDCDGPSWALWAQNGHIEICSLRSEGFAVEKVALEGRVDQVLSVCASSSASSDELFVLSAPSAHPLQQRRRIFRLSRLSSAHPSLTIFPLPSPNGHSLIFGYLYGTVERAMDEFGRLKNAAAGGEGPETRGILSHGTEELLGRLNRELDVFLMGNAAKVVDGSGGKTANTLADFLPEFGSVFPEGTTAIASGLHQMFDHIRQQSSNLFFTPAEENPLQNDSELPNRTSSETDRLSSGDGTSTSCDNSCQMRERRDSFAKMSLPQTDFNCSVDIEGEEEGEVGNFRDQVADDKLDEKEERVKVRVERKRIVIRRKRKKNGQQITRDAEDEECRDRQCETPLGQHQEDTALSDWEHERTTILKTMEKDAEGRDGWTPGAVTNDRQQQIMEVLGIVSKSSVAKSDSTEVTTLTFQETMMGISSDDKREMSNGEEGQIGMHPNTNADEEIWRREEEGEHEEMVADFQVGRSNADGYSFLSTNDAQQLLEDEFPPVVPTVSFADLAALFPAPSLPLTSAFSTLPVRPPSSTTSFTSTSSSSSLSVFSVHLSPLYQRLLQLSLAGQWRRLDVPFSVGEFTLCRHYLIACPGNKRSAKTAHTGKKQRPHYLMANLVEDERAVDEWVPLRVSASAVAVNDEGTLLWRMCDGVAYSPCSPPDPVCPSTTLSHTTAWVEMSNQFEGDIVQIALNSKNAWFLADTGRTRKERTVWTQMFLPEMGIFHRAVDEDNRHFFTQLAVSDHAVWTLSGGLVVARVGLKLELAPMGLDWADIDGQPHKFVSIALHEHTGFGLERNGTVWFVHGVAENAPFGHGPWFKVCFPPDLSSLGLSQHSSSSAEWRLHVGIPGVFIVAGSVLLHTNASLVGFHFDHVVPDRLILNDHFTLITATGFCDIANDCLFLCHPSSDELFSFSLRKRHFTSLPPYCSDSSAKVKYLSATSTCLFVLDKSGNLYVRSVGLRIANGNNVRTCRRWALVQKPNADSFSERDGAFVRNARPAKFISVAACASSIWTISDDGSIWVSHSLHPSSPIDGDPSDGELIAMTWANVQGPMNGETIDQVRVSPSGNSVWLFSKSGFAWYRTDISVYNRIGQQWTTSKAIQGICIHELAVSDSAVWALSADTAQLHRLSSVGWEPMDVRLKSLSVDSLEGRLWALDNEFRIVRHEMDVVTRPSAADSSDDSNLEGSANVAPQPTRRKKEVRHQMLSSVTNTSTEPAHWVFNFRKMFNFFR